MRQSKSWVFKTMLAGTVITVSLSLSAEEKSGASSRVSLKDEHRPEKLQRKRADGPVSQLTETVAAHLPGGSDARTPVMPQNLIDHHLLAAMQRDGIPHAGPATDQEFCRRIYLDLTGRIPTPAQLQQFLADGAPDKRTRLVNSLLSSEAWVDRWAYWFGDVLKVNFSRLGRPGVGRFDRWIRESLQQDKPYSQFVSELLTGSAPQSNWMPDAAPANFLARWHVQGDDALSNMHEDTADEIAVQAARLFLGINYQCISCHDGRPFLEKVNLGLLPMKRRDLWAMAAFFGNTRVRIVPYQDRFTVSDDGPGYDTSALSVVRLKREGGVVQPAFVLTGEKADPNKPLRPQLARMLTSHPQFARATVNLFWKEFFVLGIVDPVDSFDMTRQDPANPPPAPWTVQPTNPELLNALAADFAAHGYSLKYLMRTITLSAAYQFSSRFDGEWKESFTPYFARKYVRLLGAEEIHDEVSQATGIFGNYKRRGLWGGHEPVPAVARYFTQFASPQEGSGKDTQMLLNAFGQSNRDQFDKEPGGSILQALSLMNSPFVRKRIAAEGGSRVEEILKSGKSDRDMVQDLFVATLSRKALPEEEAVAIEALRHDRRTGLEDLQWSLMNKLDFIFNY